VLLIGAIPQRGMAAAALALFAVATAASMALVSGVFGTALTRRRMAPRLERLVPLLGAAAGDRDAYTYLPESVKGFPPPERLAAMMAAAGLERIRYLLLAGGIIAIHSGETGG
jgi:ubiquinone/menaquinone biosynthesis C-methylase UbiE